MIGAENRYYSWKKALRKKRISDQVYRYTAAESSYYSSLHQYSKNKIHCSCRMCSKKTRNKGKRRKLFYGYKKVLDYKHSDRQKLDSMDYEAWEYLCWIPETDITEIRET